MPGAPSSVLVPSSKANKAPSSVLAPSSDARTQDKECRVGQMYIRPLKLAQSANELLLKDNPNLDEVKVCKRAGRPRSRNSDYIEATRNKRTLLLEAPGIATRSKDATRGSWHRY